MNKIALPSFLAASSKKPSTTKSQTTSNTTPKSSTNTSTNTSGSWKPSDTNKPQNIDKVNPDKVTTGTVVIKKPDGTQETIKDVPLYDGAFYDKKTGQILGDTHGPDGVYSKDKWDKNFSKDEDGNVIGYWKPKPEDPPKPCSQSSSSSCRSCQRCQSCQSCQGCQSCQSCQDACEKSLQCGNCQVMSQQPPKVEWNEPFPVFNAKLKKVYRYAYHLGVDEAVFSSVSYEEDSACVTSPITIGSLKDKDYLMLEVDFIGNIEFYILDGSREIPILPVEQTLIEDEKMFYGLPLRFISDDQHAIRIKCNGININESYETIANNSKYWENNNKYSATYKPIPQNTYVPIEQHIQIKAIIRGIGSIKRLSIRYYGENYYIN